MPRTAHTNALILLHFIVLIWGFTGVLGRLISLPAEELVWCRTLIGVAGLGVLSVFRPFHLKWPGKWAVEYFITGIIIAVHWVTFFGAIKASTISVTLACLASTTAFVAVLEPIWYKRRVRLYEVVLGLIVAGALSLIFKLETEYRLGIMLALISALGAAMFTVLNGKQVQHDTPQRIAFYELLSGWIGLGIYLAFVGRLEPFSWNITSMDIVWLLILGLVCTTFAFVAGVAVMKQLSPFTVALTVNLEPVYGIMLALLFFGESEHMHPGTYVGVGIILSCLFFNGWLQRLRRKRSALASAS